MLEVNGRRYAAPRQSTVVLGIDGCEPDYIAQAVAGGHMPFMKQVLASGTALVADCVVPSFTNPNNLSIVTGAAAVGARHLRQLPVRRRERHRSDDERPEVAARADAAGRAG